MYEKYERFSGDFPLILLCAMLLGVWLMVAEVRTEMARRRVSMIAAFRLVVRGNTEYLAIVTTLLLLLLTAPIMLCGQLDLGVGTMLLAMVFIGLYSALSIAQWIRGKKD